MSIRKRIADAGRVVAGVAGDLLLGVALGDDDNDEFWKAEPTPDEGQDRAPGGDRDTEANAPVPTQPATEDPKALFWDPFAVVEQLGYKDKPSSITYGTLKSMVFQTPIIQAVI